MKATLHSITSLDWNVELHDFRPVDEAFEVMVEYVVNYVADGHEVDDVYRVAVTSPAWFERELESRREPIPGRHRLVTDSWRLEDIRSLLARLVEGCEAEDWRALRAQLSSIGAPADGY